MAEDEEEEVIQNIYEEAGEEEIEGIELTASSTKKTAEEGEPRGAPRGEPKSRCNWRIEELAMPPKRMFLALWNDHAYHLPKEKNDKLKLLLQELYAMTPEETAKYFAELRAEAKAREHRRRMKQKLRNFLRRKEKKRQRERAYRLFRRLLRCALKYAAQNPVPTLVSLRLRYLSDAILEQLCDLRKIDKPDRDGPMDKRDLFMIQVADWMAIGVERLYYVAQLAINETTRENDECVCESLHKIKQDHLAKTKTT